MKALLYEKGPRKILMKLTPGLFEISCLTERSISISFEGITLTCWTEDGQKCSIIPISLPDVWINTSGVQCSENCFRNSRPEKWKPNSITKIYLFNYQGYFLANLQSFRNHVFGHYFMSNFLMFLYYLRFCIVYTQWLYTQTISMKIPTNK